MSHFAPGKLLPVQVEGERLFLSRRACQLGSIAHLVSSSFGHRIFSSILVQVAHVTVDGNQIKGNRSYLCESGREATDTLVGSCTASCPLNVTVDIIPHAIKVISIVLCHEDNSD